jgi:hypothetical protein
MAQTLVVIGYSFNQARRRKVTIPDDDSEVPGLVDWMKSMGEQVMVGLLSDYRTIGPDAMLARYLGRPAISDRCAVVNASGIVTAHINADPAIDRHPTGTLHHDPHGKSKIGQIVNIPLY